MTDRGKKTLKYTMDGFVSRVTGSGRGTHGISTEAGKREASVDVTLTIH